MTYGARHSHILDTSTSGRVKVANEAHCRMCGRHRRVRPITRHHLVPLSWFMNQGPKTRRVRNANCNIVPLCRPCHDLVDHRDWDVAVAARRELRRSLWQPEIAFVIRIRDKHWLDLAYPLVIDPPELKLRVA